MIIIYVTYLILDMCSLWLLNTNWQLVDTSLGINYIYTQTGHIGGNYSDIISVQMHIKMLKTIDKSYKYKT